MADNVPVTAGTGTDIATDDVSSVHYQKIKLFASSDGDARRLDRDEDTAHTSGDPGVMALAVRADDATSFAAAGDYHPLVVDELGKLYVNVAGFDAALPAGNNNIGDVDVASSALPTGAATAANQTTVIGHVDGIETLLTTLAGAVKAEDAVAASADPGIMALAVRSDTATATGANGDYVPLLTDSAGRLHVVLSASANQATNVAQMNGVTVTMGNGASGTGVQRVTLASDSTGIIASIGTSVTPGTSAAHLGKAEDAAHASGDTGVMALAVSRSAANALTRTAGTDDDYNPMQLDERGAQTVVHRPYVSRLTANSSGLTTATTAYVTGDQLGAEITLASAAKISGAGGVLTKLIVIDYSDIVGPIDAFIFRAASTPASDNAANAWADANMDDLEGIISLPVVADSANNRVLMWTGAMPYTCAATSLFVNLVTRSGHTFFGAATDLRVRAHVVLD